MKRREIEVCRRLREARKRLGLSQSAVAERVRVSRDRWASYEAMRAPLKWYYGSLFCMEFDVGFRWLATGDGDFSRGARDVLYRDIVAIPVNMAFGQAYDKYLGVGFAVQSISQEKVAAAPQADRFENNRQTLRKMVGFWLRAFPEEDLGDFIKFIWTIAEDYRANKSVAWIRAMQGGGKQEIDPEVLFGRDARAREERIGPIRKAQ